VNGRFELAHEMWTKFQLFQALQVEVPYNIVRKKVLSSRGLINMLI
jgi:hypothetical protein